MNPNQQPQLSFPESTTRDLHTEIEELKLKLELANGYKRSQARELDRLYDENRDLRATAIAASAEYELLSDLVRMRLGEARGQETGPSREEVEALRATLTQVMLEKSEMQVMLTDMIPMCERACKLQEKCDQQQDTIADMKQEGGRLVNEGNAWMEKALILEQQVTIQQEEFVKQDEERRRKVEAIKIRINMIGEMIRDGLDLLVAEKARINEEEGVNEEEVENEQEDEVDELDQEEYEDEADEEEADEEEQDRVEDQVVEKRSKRLREDEEDGVVEEGSRSPKRAHLNGN